MKLYFQSLIDILILSHNVRKNATQSRCQYNHRHCATYVPEYILVCGTVPVFVLASKLQPAVQSGELPTIQFCQVRTSQVLQLTLHKRVGEHLPAPQPLRWWHYHYPTTKTNNNTTMTSPSNINLINLLK